MKRQLKVKSFIGLWIINFMEIPKPFDGMFNTYHNMTFIEMVYE